MPELSHGTTGTQGLQTTAPATRKKKRAVGLLPMAAIAAVLVSAGLGLLLAFGFVPATTLVVGALVGVGAFAVAALVACSRNVVMENRLIALVGMTDGPTEGAHETQGLFQMVFRYLLLGAVIKILFDAIKSIVNNLTLFSTGNPSIDPLIHNGLALIVTVLLIVGVFEKIAPGLKKYFTL